LPSAGSFFTDCMPMMPLAPGLVSTTTVRPYFSSQYWPIRRAVMSPEPPGAKGTTMVTGSEEDWAIPDRAHPSVAVSAQNVRRFMVPYPSA
jgi:hypothetical protein